MVEVPIDDCRTLTGLEPVTDAHHPDKPVWRGDAATPFWRWLEAEADRLRGGGIACEVFQDGERVYLARESWRRVE